MPGAMKMFIPEGANVKDVVRIVGVELKGNRPLFLELVKIPGVNFRFAHAVCYALGLNKYQALGSLTDEQLEKLEDCLRNPQKYGIPTWLFNRRRDPVTGEDKHLVGSDWEIQVKFDIKREIEYKTWRGNRHQHNLPVRGQKTRSHHRKGRTVGVIKSKELRAQQKQKEKENK
ncbi:MAG: 30S ribosomal protein S13 [Nanopusillaceae archaeon]